MSEAKATQPLEELDFEAELAALEEEQDAPATQELPAEAAKATEEVISEVAPATEVSEEEAPPSAEPAEGAPPASEEKQPDVQTTQPSLENETNKEEDVNVAEKAAPSKPAAKKPLVSRKPALKPVAAKKAEPLPAAEPSAPQKGRLLVKKAKVVEEDEAEAAEAPAAAPGPSKKLALVKKAVPAAKAPPATKKAPLLPKTKAPAVKKTPAAAAAAEPEGPAVKRAKNAYFIFSEENRAKIKEENPGSSMGELAKLLGAAYKALTEEEKAVYVAKAAEDKERMEREIAEGGVVPARKGKAAAGGKEKKPAAKRLNNAPYDLFCEEQRPILKKENPKAGAPELSKLLSDAWKKLDADEKAPYLQRSKELKAAAKEAAAAAAAAGGEDDDEDEDGAGPSSASNAASGSKKRTKAPARKGAAGSKRAKVQAADDDDDDDEVMPDAGADDDDEEDDDRENVDWEAHPALAILSKTKTMYIVARRGLPLYEYGEVPIEAANLQLRAGQTPSHDAKPCPLTLELLNEYDAFCKDFRRDRFDNTEGNELVLEHLRDGSSLEACSFLGSMREKGHELAAAEKDDAMMKIPTMATCRLMQRLLDVERREKEELKTKIEDLETQLAAALGGNGAAQKAAKVVAVKKGAAAVDDLDNAQEVAIAEA